MDIKKGDNVKVIAGKDRGKAGKVLKVLPAAERIMVEGVNVYKKHVRPRRQGEKGQTIQVSRSLAASNAKLICPACSATTRVGHKHEQSKSMRVCKKCRNEF